MALIERRRSMSANIQGSPHAHPRLVEYFVVVSSYPQKQVEPIPVECNEVGNLTKNALGQISNALKFQASVTSRYPVKNHENNPLLHESIVTFCHPSDDIELKHEHCLPKIHYFVATGGRGSMMYGVCLTIFEPFKVEVIKENEVKVEEIFQPKCICILSVYPYLVAFREWLTQLERISKSGEMTVPLERYVTNFCAEIPAPPPGSFEVQTTISDSVIKIWSPPYNQPIPWVSLPFSHLFECLEIGNIITLWHAIALERQVLVVSTQKTLLTTTCEIVLSLLFPMKWSHAYIPLLPKCLVSILSSPMPFLCGIDKSYLKAAVHFLNEECIVVDLDSNIISFGPKTPKLPPLPREFRRKLTAKLRENVGMIFREARSLRKDHDFSDRGAHLPLNVKTHSDAMWESKLSLYDESFLTSYTPGQEERNQLNGSVSGQKRGDSAQTRWDAIQEAFMNIYVDLLSSYRQCLVFPSKDGRRSIDSGNMDSYGGAGFNSKQFLRTLRQERRDFLKELINTQMFDEFITKRLYGSGAPDVTFFDRVIDNYLKLSLFSMDTSLIRKAKDKEQQKERRERSSSSAPVNIRNLFNRVKSDHDPAPILCSSFVRRRLKTVVPPDPSNENLPTDSVMTNLSITSKGSNGAFSVASKKSIKTEPTELITPLSSFESPDKNEVSEVDVIEEIAIPQTYKYELFPSVLEETLFGNPRPLPRDISAEFDRQKEDDAPFRKNGNNRLDHNSYMSPEETTFTVFFISLTAMIGRELQKKSSTKHSKMEKTILSTNNNDATYGDGIGSADNFSTLSEGGKNLLSSFDKVINFSHDDPERLPEDSLYKNRFLDPLHVSKLEEARSIARAQLDLAFEVLGVMKERNLSASPVAYKCLIDACGRCGDTDRATDLLKRMHSDGIVADGVVYSCLVAAFSAESAWKKTCGEVDIPEWANGVSVEVDWNMVGKPSSKNKDARTNVFKTVLNKVSRNISVLDDDTNDEISRIYASEPITPEKYVTKTIASHIGFGENLLEIVYPDISIDTDDERCPQCDTLLLDDMVVDGFTPGDCQDYTTTCPVCTKKFVPKFCIQSTSDEFNGSKGKGTPLICERLSPWVLEKELRLKMSDWEGIDDLLNKEWREMESKNAVLWWNLILAFMRYRIPFTFLLQGNFEKNNLIVPHTSG